jgi:hypothetical protein
VYADAYLYSEFGEPKHLCKMDDVKSFRHAIISSYDLINERYEDGRHVVKFTKVRRQSKKDLARVPKWVQGDGENCPAKLWTA